MSTLVYTNPAAVTDTSLPILRRDELLTNDSNGVRFLFDLANTFCYAAGSPSNGKTVKDVGVISSDAAITNPTNQLAAGGNGLDWTSVADGAGNRSGITIPASVVADLWAQQRYLICFYAKMPASGDWMTGNGLAGFGFSHGSGDWGSAGEIMQTGFIGNGTANIGIRAYRQTATGSTETINTGTAATHAGRITQIAMWRTAAPTFFIRLKSAGGTELGSGVAGGSTANTRDFSASPHGFGNLGTFGQYSIASTGNNTRMYRGFIENLARSGRDPVTVLDADYTRTIARGVYS